MRARKWNIPLTYPPKIKAVQDGNCTQTIRVGDKFRVGDLVSFHGWEERPYRSKRGFRTPYWGIILVEDISIYSNGIYSPWPDMFCEWDTPEMDALASLDGIDPPTGEELGRVLTSMHKIPDEGLSAQIIIWGYTRDTKMSG